MKRARIKNKGLQGKTLLACEIVSRLKVFLLVLAIPALPPPQSPTQPKR